MAAITTEEAARRLARVILSDVELYNRERPREGESLDEQYEEGRRLFASRVSPEMLGVFDAVLADRKSAKAGGVTAALPGAMTNGQGAASHQTNGQAAAVAVAPPVADVAVTSAEPTPAAADVAPVGADVAPAATSPVAAAPAAITDEANDFGNDEITATGSAEVQENLHDEPTRPTLLEEATIEQPPIFEQVMAAAPPAPVTSAPARPVTPPPKLSTPAPTAKVPTPAPAPVAVAKTAAAAPPSKVPTPLPLAVAPPPEPISPAGRLDSDRAPTPPQPIPIAAVPLAEAPVPELAATPPSGAVPTLKVRVSIPKILLVLAVAAGLVAVIAHFARLSP